MKPSEAVGNLDRGFCCFRSKECLHPCSRFRRSDETLERYGRGLIDSARGGEATFAWKGGEPTLFGLDFPRRAEHRQSA